VTEHDHRVCPRCGQAAGDYHFCPSCLAPIDSLSGIPAHARVTEAREGDAVATETAATAVQVESDERSDEDGTPAPPPEISVRPDAPLASQPPRDVARFEDVLTMASDPAVTARPVVAPEIFLRPSHSSKSPAVARLEDVLTVAPSVISLVPGSVPPPAVAPAPQPSETTVPEPAEAPASEPPPLAAEVTAIEVAAQVLREAFWFEQAAAFKTEAVRGISVPPPTPVVEPTASVAPPAVAPVIETSPPVLGPVQTSNRWLIAAFLLSLLALLVALTGRRGSGGQNS
jgi:hypothetical protein